jgi:hypothetical protein
MKVCSLPFSYFRTLLSTFSWLSNGYKPLSKLDRTFLSFVIRDIFLKELEEVSLKCKNQ